MQASPNEFPVWHGTTILTARKGGKVVVGGDGQVSIGQTVIKSNARKVRKLGKGDVPPPRRRKTASKCPIRWSTPTRGLPAAQARPLDHWVMRA